jgi:hypothetical protein
MLNPLFKEEEEEEEGRGRGRERRKLIANPLITR